MQDRVVFFRLTLFWYKRQSVMWLVEIDEKITKLAKKHWREKTAFTKITFDFTAEPMCLSKQYTRRWFEMYKKVRLYSGIKCNDKKLRSLFVNGVFKMCFNKQTKKKNLTLMINCFPVKENEIETTVCKCYF